MERSKHQWIPDDAEGYMQGLHERYSMLDAPDLDAEIDRLIEENRQIHEADCINLNPATNVMNPRAEAALARGLGTRPSLGYPGDKYEMGLEAIEKIEVIAAMLSCEIFGAHYAEIRVASGAMSNLYAFMATCQPGDRIIAPPDRIGGHITHHQAGAAGLYGLEIHPAPIDPQAYTVDLDALRILAKEQQPRLISIGGSLNLFPHPIREIRAIADEVGAYVLFDAAHLSGMIAGKGWANPLDEGAHLMTMSTYKSLGGPPSGLIVTNDAHLAQKLDQIAYPGLTANFDVSKSAALAITLLDWREYGQAYARKMAQTALSLATALAAEGIPIFGAEQGFTTSHQFAIEAAAYGGGQNASKQLREANLLACGIGLPIDPVPGDLNGLRLGTPELVRWGMDEEDMPELARFIVRALNQNEDPAQIAADVRGFRQRFQNLQYIRK